MRIGYIAGVAALALGGLGVLSAAGGAKSGNGADGWQPDRSYRQAREHYVPNSAKHQRARERGRAVLAGHGGDGGTCSQYLAAYGFAFIALDDRVRRMMLDDYRRLDCSPAELRDLEARLMRAMAGAAKPQDPAGRSL